MAAQSAIKLSAVRPYLDEDRAAAMVAGHYGEPLSLARVQVARVEWKAEQAGF
jgi:hypothetical protein